jgi:hypothetical protein
MNSFKIKYLNKKYIFEFNLFVPNIKPKNILNFRIFKIKKNYSYIQDPYIEKSLYLKNIKNNEINRFINFEFIFNEEEFCQIDEILFDFCDEGVTWYNKIIYYDNISYKNILSEHLINYLKSEEFKRII